MADPAGDVEQLRAVLELCSERGLKLARVRVGDVELTVSPSPAADGTRPPTPEQQLERARREYLETMYASSVGDLPEYGDS